MIYKYLALGDSYTIGEQVPLFENFPYQTIQMLRRKWGATHDFIAPEIVAKTGWTTDELDAQISDTLFLGRYDFVSLLIGVNNQYRGRNTENFATEFKSLLQKAIVFAGNNPSHVFVLSIPDWGITPFAADRDASQIAKEIDEYNQVCKEIASLEKVNFIDITLSQRIDGRDATFIATDGLHPSGLEYKKWAYQLSEGISSQLM
jgi:lysophospholipase L1-like esterase